MTIEFYAHCSMYLARLLARKKLTSLAPDNRGRQHSSRIGFSVAADINNNVMNLYFLIWNLSRLVSCRFWLQCSRSLRLTTLGRIPQDKWLQSQQTDIHSPGGIRTLNPRKRTAVDPRLRPSGHWDWPFRHFANSKYSSGFKFHSANVRQLEMFVRQLCTNVRIRCIKDGLGVEIYNVRKCGL
jgi:hypothetical protein